MSEPELAQGCRPPVPAEYSSDWSHIGLAYVVCFYFNQSRTDTLTDLLRLYAGYSRDVLDRILFVLVDDGSPVKVEIPPELDLNLLMLRIEEDIPWNQPGGRNLGVVYAPCDKVLLTDLDHELSEETMREILRMRNPGRTMYKMRRLDEESLPKKAHPNTFVLSRARFLQLYGYDEELTGHYGFDDALFWRWQRNNGTRFRYLGPKCAARLRIFDWDKGYHSLERDLKHNEPIAKRKREEWEVYGPEAGHSRRFLNFSWRVAHVRHRSTRPERKKHPYWTRTWIWRSLFGGL